MIHPSTIPQCLSSDAEALEPAPQKLARNNPDTCGHQSPITLPSLSVQGVSAETCLLSTSRTPMKGRHLRRIFAVIMGRPSTLLHLRSSEWGIPASMYSGQRWCRFLKVFCLALELVRIADLMPSTGWHSRKVTVRMRASSRIAGESHRLLTLVGVLKEHPNVMPLELQSGQVITVGCCQKSLIGPTEHHTFHMLEPQYSARVGRFRGQSW